MDKKLVLATAGAGKTAQIIDSLSETERNLVITYTNANQKNILSRIPVALRENTKVMKLHSFFYQHLCLPFLFKRMGLKGISLDRAHRNTFRLKRSNPAFYMGRDRRVYIQRLSQLVINKVGVEKIQARMTQFFPHVFIDEVQDVGGYDFDLMEIILGSNVNTLCVGDFYQFTYSSNQDGAKNKSLMNDFDKYLNRFKKMGVDVDTKSLSKSWRCGESICEFVREELGINISSHQSFSSKVELVEEKDRIAKIFNDDNIVKLFYQNSKKFDCFGMNWGDSKGEDRFSDVCIMLNKGTHNALKKGTLSQLNTLTRNKLYVALTRARKTVYLIPNF